MIRNNYKTSEFYDLKDWVHMLDRKLKSMDNLGPESITRENISVLKGIMDNVNLWMEALEE